jgi:hypothetical protein
MQTHSNCWGLMRLQTCTQHWCRFSKGMPALSSSCARGQSHSPCSLEAIRPTQPEREGSHIKIPSFKSSTHTQDRM